MDKHYQGLKGQPDICTSIQECKPPTLLEQMEDSLKWKIAEVAKLQTAITLLKTNPEYEAIYKTLALW